MTAALEGGEWSAARPGRTLSPGKNRYPFYRSLGGPHVRSRRAENLVPTRIFSVVIIEILKFFRYAQTRFPKRRAMDRIQDKRIVYNGLNLLSNTSIRWIYIYIYLFIYLLHREQLHVSALDNGHLQVVHKSLSKQLYKHNYATHLDTR